MSEQSAAVSRRTRNEAKDRFLKPSDADVIILYTIALIAVDAHQRLGFAFAKSLFSGVAAILNTNACQILVPTTIWFVIKSSSRPMQLNRVDYIVTILSSAWLVVSESRLSYIGATLLGANLWLRRSDDARLASVGQVLLALSTYELWGHKLFKTISAPLIEWEASCVTWVGSLLGLGVRMQGVVIVSGSDNWAILIMEGCSAFHNVALATLIWFCLIKLDGAQITKSALVALVLGVVLVICLNMFRLLAMTASVEAYNFWHDGAGVLIFANCALVAIIGPTLMAMIWSR